MTAFLASHRVWGADVASRSARPAFRHPRRARRRPYTSPAQLRRDAWLRRGLLALGLILVGWLLVVARAADPAMRMAQWVWER